MSVPRNAAVIEALRALDKPQRAPTEADRPPVQPLPGPKPRILPGQLDLDGHVYGERT
jgi:hypothetical protein